MRYYGYYQNSYKRAICFELNAMLEDIKQGLSVDYPSQERGGFIVERLENRVKAVWYYATQLANKDENVIAKLTASRLAAAFRPLLVFSFDDKTKAHVKQYANQQIATVIDYIADNGGWCSPEKPFEVKDDYYDDINAYLDNWQKGNR